MTGPGSGRRSPSPGLTHIDNRGQAHMVDVTGKALARRVAEARCSVRATTDALARLAASPGASELFESARYSGVLAAKQTSTLIPLCHPIRLDGIAVDIGRGTGAIQVVAVAEITERTGVEMEALTACAVAALVVFQALSAFDALASIDGLTLWHKSGGRSGPWHREVAPDLAR